MKHCKKTILLLVSAVLVLTAAVGTTLAYLIAGAGPVTNTFTPTKVTTEVDEGGEGTDTKTNVQIKNTGTTDAYIRAAVIVTWQDAYGNVYGQMPVEDKDYTIQWTDNTNNPSEWGINITWIKGDDGFYYHKAPVAAGGETSVLFTNCSPVEGKAPTDYFLNVEIIGSGIQANPITVVQTEWGVTVDEETGYISKQKED